MSPCSNVFQTVLKTNGYLLAENCSSSPHAWCRDFKQKGRTSFIEYFYHSSIFCLLDHQRMYIAYTLAVCYNSAVTSGRLVGWPMTITREQNSRQVRPFRH